MKRTAALLRIAWRESRTARRRLFLYMSSISLGVATLVAIDSFAANVTRSVHEQSRALLGGDVMVRGRDAYSEGAQALLDSIADAGYPRATSTNFVSMGLVQRTNTTRLVQVRAVSRGFPLYGEITSIPAQAWPLLHDGRHVVVDSSLLITLSARVGDTLALGTSSFVITGTLRDVPGEIGVNAALGPRVYIPADYLAETGLLAFGSRAEYETVFAMTGELAPAAFVSRFNRRFQADNLRMRTAGFNEARLASAISQLQDFLGVVGLIALLLGGIGVASGVHAFVMRKIDTVAILRCLGASSWQVLAIYSLQAAVMGLAGAAAGALLGIGIQFVLPRVVADFLPVDVEVTLAPLAIAVGLGLGVWVAVIFALQPLVAVRRISPLQALRREADTSVLRAARMDPLRWLIVGAIVGSIVWLGIARAGDVGHGLGFSAGIGAAIALLWIAAAGLARGARRAVQPGWAFVLRQGIASLYRPGNQTRAVVLALGFGVFLMGTLYQIERNLLRSLDVRMAESRANVVFFDVQQDQRDGIERIMREGGHQVVQSAPIVPMRIHAINGTPVRSIGGNAQGRRPSSWATRREYRSTYRSSLGNAEEMVAGRWFGARAPGDSIYEISIEQDVASDLLVGLGDTITWNVQGVLIPTRITSIREVRWAAFEPNFFVIFEPAALEHAPQQFAILAQAATNNAVGAVQGAVVRDYPNVASIDLSLVQRTVADVLNKVTMAVRFLAILSLALGVPVLFSAVAATRRERLREGVLLKTLGATRRQIGRIMLAEYAMLGALGAGVGVVLSTAGAWALMRWVFRLEFVPALGPALLVGAAMTAVAVVIGLVTGREVFARTPMAALRET